MVVRTQGVVAILLIHIALVTAVVLVDYLVPPPPIQQHPIIPSPPQTALEIPFTPKPVGFIQRIARWFGFRNSSNEKPTSFQTVSRSIQTRHNSDSKTYCNLCNQIPWIPMFPGNLQYPVLKGHSDGPESSPQIKFNYLPNTLPFLTYNPSHNNLTRNHGSDNIVQPSYIHRAVKFNNPTFLPTPNTNHDRLPSWNPMQMNKNSHSNLNLRPPLHDATYFTQPLIRNNRQQSYINYRPVILNFPKNHVPSNETTKITSEKPTLEVVKSIPLVDFESSVEYPPHIIQSPVIEIPVNQNTNSNKNELKQKLEKMGPGNKESIEKSNYLSNPIIVENEIIDQDSYPEASSYNVSVQKNKPREISYSNDYDISTKFEETFTVTEQIDVTTTMVPETTFYKSIAFTSTPTLSVLHLSEKINSAKKERQTPKHLLDSPIFYIPSNPPRPFTKSSSDYNLHTYTPQYTRAFLPTIPPNYTSNSNDQSIQLSRTFEFQSVNTPYNTSSSKKRPKNIQQLIIPYTTKIKPSPFRTRDEQNDQPSMQREYFSNWFNSHEIGAHQEQESKLVSITETPNKKTTQYLTKILATNLRELLRKEYEDEPQNKSKINFDIKRLQKNIDDWTEKEFTSSHKSSSASLHGRSKNIPTDYLTTTPLNIFSQNTTSDTNTLKHDISIKVKEFLYKVTANNQIESTDSIKFQSSTVTSTPFTTSTVESMLPFIDSVTVTSSYRDLWKSLKVSISPLTNEKVYVVTPESISQNKTHTDSIGTFKSPRFLVRPTPGNDIKQTLVTKKYTPELFGLMKYSPPHPSVETLSGHSKVVAAVTTSSRKKK